MRLRFYLDMPLDKLTSKEFAKKRFENKDMYKASVSDPAKFGHPYGGDNTTNFSVLVNMGMRFQLLIL